MTVCKDIIPDLLKDAKYMKDIDIQVIQPGEHDRWTNTIMDIIPISTKVLWSTWRGYHAYDHGCVCNSDRSRCEWKAVHMNLAPLKVILKEISWCLNRAGTPGDDDVIISFDVTLSSGNGTGECLSPTEAHLLCDKFIDSFSSKIEEL